MVRADSSSVAISASRNCSAWNLISSSPNALRVRRYSITFSSAERAPPSEHDAMLSRPPLRPRIAMVNPMPSSPMRLATGTRASSKTTCAVGCACQPILRSGGPKDSPGVPLGTTMVDMPRGPGPPVRAITTYRSAVPAPEMNCLTPLSTY
ncbi:Uncharacterised protein [Mycobacteroides abscessus]|nr:Uncharacterised protein [Mycobacteroides abscessus]